MEERKTNENGRLQMRASALSGFGRGFVGLLSSQVVNKLKMHIVLYIFLKFCGLSRMLIHSKANKSIFMNILLVEYWEVLTY